MRYYVVRYIHGLKKMVKWLPVIFLPVLVYLLSAAAKPDRFMVSQTIAVQKTAPIAISKTPVDCQAMSDLLLHPVELFLDDFSLMELLKQSPKDGDSVGEKPGMLELKDRLEASMTLKPDGSDHVRIEYSGDDLVRGKYWVTYFAQRLVNRSKEGIVRTLRQKSQNTISQSSHSQSGSAVSVLPAAALEGEPIVREERSLWRPNRLTPACEILLLALLGWCIAAGIVEWLEPSFVSERQISRYLNIPVIGIMPDLGVLAERLEMKGAERNRGTK